MSIPNDHFDGGKNLTSKSSSGKPSEDLASLLNGSAVGSVPAWTTGLTVTTHVYTHTAPAWVLAVEATTATSAGPKQQQTGAPAAGEVQVAYDADGIPTLTFNATDAVTEAAVSFLPIAAVS